MKSPKISQNKAALIFLGAALLIVVTLTADRLTLPNWQPLNTPFQLRVGTVKTPQFKIDDSSEYLINIDFERKIEFQKLSCLIGMETLYPDRCKDIPDTINLTWTLFKDDKVVAKGSSGDFKSRGYFGETIGRTIGSFTGDKLAIYTFQVNILKNAEELDKTNPKIKIEVHPDEYEKRGYYYGLLLLLAAIIGIPAGLTIVVDMMSRYWDNRKRRQVKN